MTALALDLIADERSMAALRPEWEALWRRTPSATPFQSPAWLLPWWRQFGTGLPRIAVIYEEARLSSLLPLYLLEDGGERKLLPIGVGITDYCDALIAPDAPANTAGALLRAALTSAGADRATACELIDLPPGSALRQTRGPAGWRMARYETEPCPVLTIPEAAPGLGQAIPARMFRKLRMNRHRADRAGGWRIQTATEATVSSLLDELVRLHAMRWTSLGEAGVLADPRVRAFHREAAPGLLAMGALRLQVLRIGHVIAAAIYALLAGTDRLFFYLSGFDPAFAFQSPGTILLGTMIEQAISEGRRELHFLRGKEAYKYAWGGNDRMNSAIRLTPLGLP